MTGGKLEGNSIKCICKVEFRKCEYRDANSDITGIAISRRIIDKYRVCNYETQSREIPTLRETHAKTYYYK